MYAFSVILLIRINISGNVHFICSQCVKLYMYTVCTLLGIATFFLHTCFKDGSSRHIFIYKFWPRFKIFYRLARTFKTQMTSKIFKFGDLGDSSMNNFVGKYFQILSNIWYIGFSNTISTLWYLFGLSYYGYCLHIFQASLLDYWNISGKSPKFSSFNQSLTTIFEISVISLKFNKL